MDNKQQTKPSIPFVLLHEEAGNKIFNAVNEAASVYKIPFCAIEQILTNILHQIREQTNIELEQAKQAYQKQLEEYNKAQEAEKAEGENKTDGD